MLIYNYISFYGLVYVIGFILFIFIKHPLVKKYHILYNLYISVFVSISTIVFARLFYTIFYEGSYYINNLSEVYMLYKGGMSIHGGIIGCILGLIFIDKKHFFYNADRACLVATICLPLGRIANFLNGEIYGRVTNESIGFIFLGKDLMYRHAVQLYEGFCVGPLMLLLLYILYKKNKIKREGDIAIFFIYIYFIIRFCLEFFREPDKSIGFILTYFTMGQLLSLGVCLIVYILLKFKFYKS